MIGHLRGARKDRPVRRAFVSVVAAALGVGAVVCTANDARALGPLDLEVGLKGGVGSNPDSAGGAPNPLGVGLGGRAGVSIFGLYGGIQAMYYLGGSGNLALPTAGSGSGSLHSTLYGVEAGYGFKLAILTIRPQIGLGNYTLTTSADGSPSSSQSHLYLEPGVTGLVSLGLIYVGADINYLIIPGVNDGSSPNASTTWGALTVHGQVGLTF
jgi:hypothetical protein